MAPFFQEKSCEFFVFAELGEDFQDPVNDFGVLIFAQDDQKNVEQFQGILPHNQERL